MTSFLPTFSNSGVPFPHHQSQHAASRLQSPSRLRRPSTSVRSGTGKSTVFLIWSDINDVIITHYHSLYYLIDKMTQFWTFLKPFSLYCRHKITDPLPITVMSFLDEHLSKSFVFFVFQDLLRPQIAKQNEVQFI